MLEHRAVYLLKNVFTDVNFVVRVDSHDVDVVGRVVDLAQAQAVGSAPSLVDRSTKPGALPTVSSLKCPQVLIL